MALFYPKSEIEVREVISTCMFFFCPLDFPSQKGCAFEHLGGLVAKMFSLSNQFLIIMHN